MTIPFWCLLVGCILPYVWIGFTAPDRAKLEGGMDNARPREQQAELIGFGARALGAHNNAFEALPAFIAGVMVSHVGGGDPTYATYLAIAWVVLRVLHGALYLANVWPLRSLCFALGLCCSLALIALPALS